MEKINYSLAREIPVVADVDVLVVGGGAAGIAAAYCAARRGKKTLLAERNFSLGGTGGSGLVGPFMTSSDPKGERQLIQGFFRELVDRLIAAGGALEPMNMVNGDSHTSWHPWGHRNLTPFNAEIFKCVAEELCLEQGVELLYAVQSIDVLRSEDGKKINSVIFLAKEGLICINAKVVIDCTGDGDIAYQANCPMMKGDEVTGEMQAAGLFFSITGIDEAKLQKRSEDLGWESMRFETEIALAVENEEYPIPRRRLGLYKANDNTWRANVTRIPDVDGTKSGDLTHVAIEGRKQIQAIIKFLRKYISGCENVELLQTAELPGIRETRRIKGDFVLKEQSLIDGEIFDDAILTLSNSRDNHYGLIGKYIPSTTSYTLPYRVLVPATVDNLLVAGRNVSCDRVVLSAIRVMPPCFGLGQAAGNAAALAIDANCPCKDIDNQKLISCLKQENVII